MSVQAVVCPKCSAPVDLGALRCQYCHSTLEWKDDQPILVEVEIKPRSVVGNIINSTVVTGDNSVVQRGPKYNIIIPHASGMVFGDQSRPKTVIENRKLVSVHGKPYDPKNPKHIAKYNALKAAGKVD